MPNHHTEFKFSLYQLVILEESQVAGTVVDRMSEAKPFKNYYKVQFKAVPFKGLVEAWFFEEQLTNV